MCLGPFSKICHWGPLSAMGITKCVTGMTIHCSGMLWPGNSWPGLLNTLCFMSLAGLTIYNFLSSISHGPGYLPYNWMPDNEDDIKFMQYCTVCKSYKAPRSHHCRKCKRCVLKMDHHCPWINNCVGWGNHAHFVAFLTSATLGCFHSSIVLSYTLYKSLYRVHYIKYGLPQVSLGLYGTILCVLSLGFAIGVVCAVGMLLFFQFRSVIRNQTGIEDWIVEKANYRLKNSSTCFRFPYNLGIYGNIKQVLNFTCQPVGNGIDWKLAEGCDKYTLTKEQQLQKMEKRDRARLYIVKQPASGYWFPISYGLKTCYHPPCTDEDRIKLNIGDTVLVTRWRRYWLFGEKQLVYEENTQSQRIRGWFPRGSAVELDEVDSSPAATLSNKKTN